MNALSLGCSGINSAMGPLRPAGVAATAFLLARSWILAWPHRWASAALTTAVSLLLTFSPEMIEAAYRTRLQGAPGGRGAVEAAGVSLEIKKGSMGCVSCVSKVQATVEGLEGVAWCLVDFAGSKLVAGLTCPPGRDADVVRANILEALVTPSCPPSCSTLPCPRPRCLPCWVHSHSHPDGPFVLCLFA